MENNALLTHERWMREAIGLAPLGFPTIFTNPCVGAIIVRDGACIAQGYHHTFGGAHAEIVALSQAEGSLSKAQLYVTLEPCAHHGKTPPCTEAIINSGIKTVIFGSIDPNPNTQGKGIRKLEQAGIHVIGPVLEVECKALNPGFFKRFESGQPFVRLKSASSLDGKMAAADGTSQWITNAKARENVHQIRQRCQAIITSTHTICSDNPRLSVRVEGKVEYFPWVVVLGDSAIPKEAQIFQTGTKVICMGNHISKKADIPQATYVDWNADAPFQSVLDYLGNAGINEVLLESGPRLLNRWLESGLFDIWHCYIGTLLIGDGGSSLYQNSAITTMNQAKAFNCVDSAFFDGNLRLDLMPAVPEHS